MKEYFFLLMGAVFVNNVLLVRNLGICPFFGVSRKYETSIGMGLATTFVLTLGTGLSSLIFNYFLQPFNLVYLRTASFIFIIVTLVQFFELLLRKKNPHLYQLVGIYLPLVATNCAVLGIPLLSAAAGMSFLPSLIFGFGSAIGFALVLMLFSAMRERLDSADIPAPFRGSAIAMICAGLMSLAFMGFAGLDKYR